MTHQAIDPHEGWAPLPRQDSITRRISAARVLTRDLTPCVNSGWLPSAEEVTAAIGHVLALLGHQGQDVAAALVLVPGIVRSDQAQSADAYGPHRAEHYAAAPALSTSGLYEAEVLFGWAPEVSIPGEPPIRRTSEAVAEILAGFVHLARQAQAEQEHGRS